MSERIILASTSTVRRELLDAAKVCYTAISPKIDEMELQVECEKKKYESTENCLGSCSCEGASC